MFQLQVFDNSVSTTTKGNCLQMCGNGLWFVSDNGGQYLTFGQSYTSTEGAYVITQTTWMSKGQIIFFKNTSPTTDLTWFFGKGHTNLTITHLC